LFRTYDTWKLTQPADRNRFQPDTSGFENDLVKVPLEAGDLLIFHSAQPHGIRPNLSKDKTLILNFSNGTLVMDKELHLPKIPQLHIFMQQQEHIMYP
jgi:ectoine hydroxylase-related dioxygenase (phytanoyl-CoA dioxygenase family)